MRYLFFVYSFLEGQLGGFCALHVVNNAAMNTGMQMCLQDCDFSFFGYIRSSVIAGSYSSVFLNIHLLLGFYLSLSNFVCLMFVEMLLEFFLPVILKSFFVLIL